MNRLYVRISSVEIVGEKDGVKREEYWLAASTVSR